MAADRKSIRRGVMIGCVILVVIAFGMTMLGTFTKPADEFLDLIALQAEIFEREIVAHQEEMSARSKDLSSEASEVIDEYLFSKEIRFDDVENSPEHIENLQKSLLELLRYELYKSDLSGAFILLDTTVNSNVSGAEYSRSGLYLQRASQSLADDTLILYRGDHEIGKAADIMPHRKWQLEFDTRLFPDYDKIINTSHSVPLERTVGFTDLAKLPGTSEKAILVTMPIRGKDGDIFGICGFEISETNFKKRYAQPTTLDRLMCVWAPYGASINSDEALVCGTEDGYFLPFFETLSIGKSNDGLTVLAGESNSYIGILRPIEQGVSDKATLAVIIPKEDYDKAVSTNTFRVVSFLILLSFFAITFCRILSKRFIAPIVKGLEKIRTFEHGDSVSSLSEMNDLFAFLAQKDREYEVAYESLTDEKEKAQAELTRVQSEIEKLAYSRKNEIDPDDYENFVIGIKMLTKSERNIFEMYLDGKTGKDIIETTGIKESTLKFHNSNIYEKLGVSSRKQMLRYAALYMQEHKNG